MTKMYLDRLNVEYEERDTDNKEYMSEAFEHAGMSIVPVLVFGDNVVTGYQPGKLRSIFQG